METGWRPLNWDEINPDHCKDCPDKMIDDYGMLCDLSCGKYSAYRNRENGADKLWKSVCDYIAELSKDERDDKMFRVKLFLWLTKEEK